MLDPVTQQYYLRARFYNPVIGRFTQEDTYYGDGLNLYQYCQANPVGYVDPSGHNICPTQLDLYKKYVDEGMSSKAAYDRMREELGFPPPNLVIMTAELERIKILGEVMRVVQQTIRMHIYRMDQILV